MSVAALDAASLTTLVARHENVALAQLTAALDGVALCRLDARAAEPAKHWEGMAAALAQVRRDLRRHAGPGEPGQWEGIVLRRLDEWREQASDLAPSAAPAWSVYLAGGIAALSELLEETPTAAEDHR